MFKASILLVAHDPSLLGSRAALLAGRGFAIELAESDDEAIGKVGNGSYDLIVIGRDASYADIPLDQRLAESSTTVPVLKIDEARSRFAQVVSSNPRAVLAAVEGVLQAKVRQGQALLGGAATEA